MKRWITYQKERFPVLQHGPLVAAFSSCAVLYAAMLGNSETAIAWSQFLAAFIVCLLFFLQLRIADEFKDADEDARHRPYRAVPRGLVKLQELGWVFAGGCVIQLLTALLLHPPLLWVLLPSWAYLAGMSVEFGVRDWLKARPITYMWTHMFIMPIVDFFATACHWSPASGRPPVGLAWFLTASFLNGVVLEVGRKLRVPEMEEEGVPTYSKQWGMRPAAMVWLVATMATLACGAVAGWRIGFGITSLILFSIHAMISVIVTLKFCSAPTQRLSKSFELVSALGTLVLYLTLGVIAYYFRK